MEDEENTNKNKTNFNLSTSNLMDHFSSNLVLRIFHIEKCFTDKNGLLQCSCMKYECLKIVFVKYTLVCCVPECIDFSWLHNTIMFPD